MCKNVLFFDAAENRFDFTQAIEFRVVRVRTLLLTKVPRCKDPEGKDLFIVAQAVHSLYQFFQFRFQVESSDITLQTS
jgi:hypothetical protein